MIFPDFNVAYLQLARKLKDSPVIKSRAGNMRECCGVAFRVYNPESYVTIRKFSPAYAAGELLWYLSWDNRGDMITHYAPSYSKYLALGEDGISRADGGYGTRLREQMPDLLAHLHNSKLENSRQAVVTIYGPQDVDHVTKDCPCTLSFQFLRREGQLDMIVTMRSNDFWLGMPYDVFCFSRIQIMIAQDLGLDVGWYQHQVGSLHLYDKDREKLDRLDEMHEFGTRSQFKTRPALNFLSSCISASALEYQIRREGLSVADTENRVRLSPVLKDTWLGSICVLASMQTRANVCDSKFVDPLLTGMVQ